MEHGATAEVAVAGNLGVVGIALFMREESTPYRAMMVTVRVRVTT